MLRHRALQLNPNIDQTGTARLGQADWDSQTGTSRLGQPDWDSQTETARLGQPDWDSQTVGVEGIEKERYTATGRTGRGAEHNPSGTVLHIALNI